MIHFVSARENYILMQLVPFGRRFTSSPFVAVLPGTRKDPYLYTLSSMLLSLTNDEFKKDSRTTTVNCRYIEIRTRIRVMKRSALVTTPYTRLLDLLLCIRKD